MKAVVQRVSQASVVVDNAEVGAIGGGLLILLGIHRDDSEEDLTYLAGKIVGLRVFTDENGKMNRSIVDVGGSILLVSQFTLYGDTRKGRRPGFDHAARPDKAIPLYERMVNQLKESVPVETGVFGAKMTVSLTNDGPVTLVIDSNDRKG